MKCMVYISLESRRLTRADIHDILHSSRQGNQARGITGVLMFYDGLFLQVLEGEDEVVDGLISQLRADSRHQDIRILLDETITQRHFPDWSMALVDMADLPAEDRWLYRHLDRPLPELESAQLADRIRRLVTSFQAMVRGAPTAHAS